MEFDDFKNVKKCGLHHFQLLLTIFDDKMSFIEVMIWHWVLKKLTHWIEDVPHWIGVKKVAICCFMFVYY
jgi:hypothetical protein